MQYVAFDIESTDGCFANGNLCEFGYVVADENFNIIEQNNILVKPVTKDFTASFHIKLAYPIAVYKKAPPFVDNYERIKKIMCAPDTIVLGHAIHNDIICINAACGVNTLPCYNFRYIDTQLLYSAYNDIPNIMSLDKIATAMEEEFLHHRADEDARLSLITLRHLLKVSGKTFDELISSMEGTIGFNESGKIIGFTLANCVSTAPSLTSKNSKRRLMSMFRASKPNMDNIPKTNTFYKKRISIDQTIFFDDIDITRAILQKISDIGGRYTSNSLDSDYHVTDGDQSNNKRCINISYDEFKQLLGDYEVVAFDDEEIIKEYLAERKAIKNQERIDRYKREAYASKIQLDAKI